MTLKALLYFAFIAQQLMPVMAKENSYLQPSGDTTITKTYFKNKKLKSESLMVNDTIISVRNYYYGKDYYGYRVIKKQDNLPYTIEAFKEFYLNGVFKVESMLVNNYWHGIYKSYWENGTLACLCNYKFGKQDSTQYQYNDKGILVAIKNYTNGIMNGTSTLFNEEGKKLFDFYFENGVLIKIIETETVKEYLGEEYHHLEAVDGKIYVLDMYNKIVSIAKLKNGEIILIKNKQKRTSNKE